MIKITREDLNSTIEAMKDDEEMKSMRTAYLQPYFSASIGEIEEESMKVMYMVSNTLKALSEELIEKYGEYVEVVEEE